MRQEDGKIEGHVIPGFETVRDVFIENLHSGADVGASFAVSRRGEVLVDLWGGYADKHRSRSVQRNTLFNLFSTTKGLTATCIALLVERGKLAYEAPVVEYWGEFGAHGKHALTVAQLMSHQAGLCGLRESVTIEGFYAHSDVARRLASQVPFFEPGTAWGYHALTIGTLADELVRRVDGRTLGEFFAAEVALPLNLDIYIGLPESEDGRQAEMIAPPGGVRRPPFVSPNASAFHAVFENPELNPEWPNTRAWRAAGIPAGGASANARGLARLYGALAGDGKVEGKRLLTPETIAEARNERIAGADQVSGEYGRYAAGFQLNVMSTMGPNPESFGHDGWGGSIAFADPGRGLGIAYVMNQMRIPELGQPDPRLSRLLDATYGALQV